MNLKPWELPHRGAMSRASMLDENPLISKAAGYGEDTAHFFVKDARPPVRAGEAVRLDPRLPGRGQVADLGTRLPALEQVRVRRAGEAQATG